MADDDHPADGGAGHRALPDEPVHRDRRRRDAHLRRWLRHFRPWQRALSGRGAVPGAGRDAALPRARTSRAWASPRRPTPSTPAPPLHVLHRLAGPGTANLLTASALAHANRLPMLMLCGDTFLTRLPDPVLQQLEHFGNPALGLNDAFKAVTPLLGPDHPSRADHPDAACGARHDARPRRLRPGLPRVAAGRAGLGL
jgi:hypothetical protein